VTWDETNVILVGSSAGGNLALMAGALGSGDTRPDEVATWSATVELQATGLPRTGDPHPIYGCDGPDVANLYPGGQSSDPGYCWGSVNRYTNCRWYVSGVEQFSGNASCVGSSGTYATASPFGIYSLSSGPPVFFSNGGGPVADIGHAPGGGYNGPETIGLQEAREFDQRGWSGTSELLCVVDQPLHATKHLAEPCDSGGSDPVLLRTVTFLDANKAV
jgi:hypothetical protein